MTLSENQFPKTTGKSKLNVAQIVQAFIGSKAEQRHVGAILGIVLGLVFHKSFGTAPTLGLETVAGAVLALESVGEHFGLKL